MERLILEHLLDRHATGQHRGCHKEVDPAPAHSTGATRHLGRAPGEQWAPVASRHELPNGGSLLNPVTADDPLGRPQLRHGVEHVLEELHVALRRPRLPRIVTVERDHAERLADLSLDHSVQPASRMAPSCRHLGNPTAPADKNSEAT